ncbi:MAG: hypothetical protein EPN47_01100 [Acidobacteria bacterium]|nr:MAG: hypothetical protein EPN47_01100 [Acidobacteriota bacterium]
MGNKDRFVDELLDSALANQRAAAVRPGIEARIMDRVRAAAGDEIAAGTAWKLWVAAAATIAVVMMIAVIRLANRSHGPAGETSQAVNAVSSTSRKETLAANSGANPKAGTATTALKLAQIEHPVRKSSRQAEAHYWPAQFPTPAPLTAEQKALVQYVRETPPQVLAEPILKAELTVQHVEIKPLEIPPLEIQPLALGAGHEEMQ